MNKNYYNKQLQDLNNWDSIAKYCVEDQHKICHKNSFKDYVCKHILSYSGYNVDKYKFKYKNSTFCTIISEIFQFIKMYKVKLNSTDQYYLNVEKNNLFNVINNHSIETNSINYKTKIDKLNELKNFLNYNNYNFASFDLLEKHGYNTRSD